MYVEAGGEALRAERSSLRNLSHVELEGKQFDLVEQMNRDLTRQRVPLASSFLGSRCGSDRSAHRRAEKEDGSRFRTRHAEY
jgi:hypothetical protein